MLQNAILAMLTAMQNYNNALKLGNINAAMDQAIVYISMRDLLTNSGYELNIVTVPTEANPEHKCFEYVTFDERIVKMVKGGLFDKLQLDDNMYRFN